MCLINFGIVQNNYLYSFYIYFMKVNAENAVKTIQ